MPKLGRKVEQPSCLTYLACSGTCGVECDRGQVRRGREENEPHLLLRQCLARGRCFVKLCPSDSSLTYGDTWFSHENEFFLPVSRNSQTSCFHYCTRGGFGGQNCMEFWCSYWHFPLFCTAPVVLNSFQIRSMVITNV